MPSGSAAPAPGVAGERSAAAGPAVARIYYATEFADGTSKTRPLSVAMVCGDDEIYRVADDWHAIRRALDDPWLRENVAAYLPLSAEGRPHDWIWDHGHADVTLVRTPDAMASELREFVLAHENPQLWAWKGAYDHVVVRHLFGRITQRPEGWPQWTGELAALHALLGSPELPDRPVRHHALEDARWTQDAGEYLLRRWRDDE
jgi:3' exoribonuclease, RNase T-like